MPQLATATNFPSFETCDPSAYDFTCIFPLARKGFRQCRIHVNQAVDRTAAALLRTEILSRASPFDRQELLEEYALKCCCRRFHRTQLQDSQLLEKLCQRWQTELAVKTEDGELGRSAARDDKASHPKTESSAVKIPLEGTSTPPRSDTRYSLRSRGLPAPIFELRPSVRAQSCADGFERRATAPSETVLSAFTKPLTNQDLESGYIYIFTRTSSPGLVKIGLTTRPIEVRFLEMQARCHYIPHLQHSMHTPNVYRVESLVHFELAKYWRRETNCNNNLGCQTKHKEWFEVDLETAKEAVNKCVQLITAAQPYDESRELTNEWRMISKRLKKQRTQVTVQRLLDALSEIGATQEDEYVSEVESNHSDPFQFSDSEETLVEIPLTPSEIDPRPPIPAASDPASALASVSSIIQSMLALPPDQLQSLCLLVGSIRDVQQQGISTNPAATESFSRVGIGAPSLSRSLDVMPRVPVYA